MQDRSAPKSRLAKVGGPLVVPEGADPVKVAEDHARTLAPGAVKELEYLSKFGSDQMRYLVNKDLLAMSGLTTKPKDNNGPPVTMNFHVGDLPVTKTGVPIMPFSNAAKKLAATVDSTATPVTVPSDSKKDT